MEIFFGVGALLFNAATAIIVFFNYNVPAIFGFTSIPVDVHQFFVSYGYLGLAAFIAFACSSGYETKHPFLYKATFVVAVIGLIVVNLTLGTVLYRAIVTQGGPPTDLNQVLAIAGSMPLLLALAGFTWWDVFYIQFLKWRELLGGEARERRESINEPARGATTPPTRAASAQTELVGHVDGDFFNFDCTRGSTVNINTREDGPPHIEISPPTETPAVAAA